MKRIILFDVDGTLTVPMNKITDEMLDTLKKISQHIDIGFVGGSNIEKITKQLGEENLKLFKYGFAENGLHAFENNTEFHKVNLIKVLGEQNYQKIINVCLKVLSEVNIPVKRSNFVEVRNGMINISPIGRSCSQEERDNFYEYDQKNSIRKTIVEKLKVLLKDYNLTFAVGGQISIDITNKGWDKTYCLQFIESKYQKIYFFGDKTEPMGNDHEIYMDPRIEGHSVLNYHNTIEILNKLW
jgi:phosphomannomutase